MYLPAYTRMLLDMHKEQPITGNFLSIGRQTVPFTFDEAAEFLKAEGITPNRNVLIALDDSTVARQPGWITDHTFFAMFCDAEVQSLDISRYERADILHDLNTLIPNELCEIADFIFEGSCLDNMFNPAQAVMNIDLMLRPQGRLFMVNIGNIVPGDTYVALGEEWYYGFLEQNGYDDVSVEAWSYDKVDDPVWTKGRDGRNCCVVVKARKQNRWHPKPVQPIQFGYDIQHRPLHYKLKNLKQRAFRRLGL